MEPKERQMTDPARSPRKKLTHLEKVVLLVMVLLIAWLFSSEVFPNNRIQHVKNVIAVPMHVFVIAWCSIIVWRDPPLMKVIGALIAVVAAYVLVWNLKVNFGI